MFLPFDKTYAYFSNEYSLKKSSNGWWDFKCPICSELEHRKKMSVHFRYGWVKCWVCGYNDSIINFVMEQEGLKWFEAKSLIMGTASNGFTMHELEDSADTTVLSSLDMPYGYVPLL